MYNHIDCVESRFGRQQSDIAKKVIFNFAIVFFFFVPFADDGDTEADEEEGHFTNDNEKDENKEKDRIDETMSEEGSPEHPNGDISVSLLRAKNLTLLQSQ